MAAGSFTVCPAQQMEPARPSESDGHWWFVVARTGGAMSLLASWPHWKGARCSTPPFEKANQTRFGERLVRREALHQQVDNGMS
jgi:hypothetical protein